MAINKKSTDITITGMCRGAGACYIVFDISRISDPSHLSVAVKSERGVKLPFAIYNSESIVDLPEKVIVLSTPSLSTKKLIVEFIERKNGKVISKTKKTISRERLKWVSRLNYKIQSQLMETIKAPESKLIDKYVRIIPVAFCSYGQNNERFLFKSVIQSSTPISPESISVVNGSGEGVEDFEVFLGSAVMEKEQGKDIYAQELSLRIPNDDNTYCLVLSSKIGNGCFYCFDPDSQRRLSILSDPHFFKSTLQENYLKVLRDQNYELAFRASKMRDETEGYYFGQGDPFFSIVVPLYKTPVPFLTEMVNSIFAQSFENWELVLVNASPEDEDIAMALNLYDDKRLKVITLNGNCGISENTNVGIDAARGSYIVFFDHDDLLDRNALSEYYQQIQRDPKIDVLYCDEDFITEDGEFVSPHFKSDFNIDLLRCHNYITHLLAVRADITKQLMLNKAYDGAQDYDFILRLSEITDNIYHVPFVLYHWRIHANSTASSPDSKNYADEAGRKALQDHVCRLGIDAIAETTDRPCFYRLKYNLKSEPRISIIIPNKDHSSILENCVRSVFEKTLYSNYEVIIVENNSSEDVTFDVYNRLESEYDVKVLKWNEPFNYSAINNFGVSQAQGKFIVLLNNDTEVIEPSWLQSMVAVCQREDVGVVGAKLLYPDDTIQHAGIAFISSSSAGEYGGPIHIFSNCDKSDEGYMRRAVLRQDVLAVTGACMMIKKAIFDELGGLDESYSVAFNDVDFCMQVIEAGYLVVFEPDAVLYHYESISRGSDQPSSKNYPRFLSEQGLLRYKRSKYFNEGDPYFGEMSVRIPT